MISARKTKLGPTVLISAGVMVVALAPSAAQAEEREGSDSQPAGPETVQECVLPEDGSSTLTCKPQSEVEKLSGALAASLWQHPYYKGERLNIRLPDGQTQCSSPWEVEEPRDLPHGRYWDNRISSLKTYNKCDIKLWDGHNLNQHKRGHTGWIESCDRLSLKSGKCKYWEGPKKRFDNTTSSLVVS